MNLVRTLSFAVVGAISFPIVMGMIPRYPHVMAEELLQDPEVNSAVLREVREGVRRAERDFNTQVSKMPDPVVSDVN